MKLISWKLAYEEMKVKNSPDWAFVWALFVFYRFFDFAQNDKKQKSEWRKQVKTWLKTENGLLLISKIPHIQFQRKEIREIIAAANSCIGDGVI